MALEANACGLPVVTVNHKRNAACDFITNNKNGFICELSEWDIAQKALQAIDSNDRLREKCLEYAKGYDWNRIVDEVDSLYRGIVAR